MLRNEPQHDLQEEMRVWFEEQETEEFRRQMQELIDNLMVTFSLDEYDIDEEEP